MAGASASLLFLLTLVGSCMTENILIMSPVPSPSHFIWLRPLINQLAVRGHNVTVLSTDIVETPPINVTYIHLENFYSTLYNTSSREKLQFFNMAKESPIKMLNLLYEFGSILCEKAALTSVGMRSLLNYPKDFKFDLFLSDYMIGPCIPSIIMHRFKDVPYIPAAPYNGPSTSSALLGSYTYSGLVPNHVFDAPEEMGFVERLKNFYYDAYEIYIQAAYQYPDADRILRKLYPDAPSVESMQKNIRISLINVNPVIQYKEPMMPNLVPVGGMQIVPPKSLPKDLEMVVERAKNGFILFSLGSNARSDLLGPERITHILTALGRLPQYQFLWKFESDLTKLPMAVPKNVFIRAWMPQRDLLGHPNIKLFITHSGLLSTQEAIWSGVPIIGFPVFADQFRNINYCVKAGVAKRLSIHDFQANELVDAITEILGDDKYATNMKRMSELFRDQPESPLDRAVWWCEWVLRNPDANVMQSTAANLSWMRKYSYDVIAFLLLIVTVLVALSVRLIMAILHLVTKEQQGKNKKD